MDDETPNKRILDKTADELTLGDNLKATAAIMATFVVITGAISAAPVVFDAARTKLRERRAKRAAAKETPEDL